MYITLSFYNHKFQSQIIIYFSLFLENIVNYDPIYSKFLKIYYYEIIRFSLFSHNVESISGSVFKTAIHVKHIHCRLNKSAMHDVRVQYCLKLRKTDHLPVVADTKSCTIQLSLSSFYFSSTTIINWCNLILFVREDLT